MLAAATEKTEISLQKIEEREGTELEPASSMK